MKLNYFNFKKFGGKVLLTNDFGRFGFVTPEELEQIVADRVEPGSPLEERLLAGKILFRDEADAFSAENLRELGHYRAHVNVSTSLHIFVVTTACNMNCVYCQANNGSSCSNLFMSEETARRAVDIALESPERWLNIEFQGGEPLLNFEIIKYIVRYAEANQGEHELEFNLVSNLTLLTEEIIKFLKKHNIGVSTSIDGPQILHDRNRPFRDGGGTFEVVRAQIRRLRAKGIRVSAIQTTTRETLKMPRELARSYAELGFGSIFVRPLTPLGKAAAHWDEIGYTPEEFVAFYREVCEELLEINREGTYLREELASMMLAKMNGAFVNYMDLRSPCGAGIGQLAYYADGNIFTCDEGRMLFEMGDDTFLLGNVHTSHHRDLMGHCICRKVCAASVLEALPSCCDCVYRPYCGVCPVVNHALYADMVERSPRGYRCRIYGGVLDYIFGKYLEDDEDAVAVLESWGL